MSAIRTSDAKSSASGPNSRERRQTRSIVRSMSGRFARNKSPGFMKGVPEDSRFVVVIRGSGRWKRVGCDPRPANQQRTANRMALTATMYRFSIQLSDVDRGVYETLDLHMARHPPGAGEYML